MFSGTDCQVCICSAYTHMIAITIIIILLVKIKMMGRNCGGDVKA